LICTFIALLLSAHNRRPAGRDQGDACDTPHGQN